MQEPVTIQLGTSYKYKKRGAKRQLVDTPDTFQYIPKSGMDAPKQGSIQRGNTLLVVLRS